MTCGAIVTGRVRRNGRQTGRRHVHDAVEDPQRIDCVNLAVANSSCQDVRDPCRTTIAQRDTI
jgi:hypothetical protein